MSSTTHARNAWYNQYDVSIGRYEKFSYLQLIVRLYKSVSTVDMFAVQTQVSGSSGLTRVWTPLPNTSGGPVSVNLSKLDVHIFFKIITENIMGCIRAILEDGPNRLGVQCFAQWHLISTDKVRLHLSSKRGPYQSPSGPSPNSKRTEVLLLQDLKSNYKRLFQYHINNNRSRRKHPPEKTPTPRP